MKRRAIAAAIGLAVVGCVALGVVIWFTLNSSGTGTASADGICNTVLLADVSAGERWISVADLTNCDVGTWIVINPATGTEEYHRVEDTGSFNLLKLDTGLAFGHSVGERVEEVLCVEPISPGIHCGTYGALEPWPDAEVTLNPDSGPAGSAIEVELTNIRANGACQQHTEVLWGWSPSGGGEEIGSGYVNAGATSLTLDATVPDDAGPGEGSVTACWWHFLDYTWYYQDAPFEVTEPEGTATPTPTPTPTGTPTATPVPPPDWRYVTPILLPSPITKEQVDNCPGAERWAMAVWEGSDGTDADEALATCGEGALDVAYALDPGTGQWLRWFRDRPEISTLTALENMEGFLALGSRTASPTPTVEPALPEPGQMRGCPLPGKWSLAVWQGPDGGEVGAAMDADSDGDEVRAAMDTCGVWQADVAYSLDPETGGWARWFRDRPEISTLDGVQFLGTYLVFSGVPGGGGPVVIPPPVPGGGGPVVKPGVGDLIAFSSAREESSWDDEIYVMYENGAKQTRITNSPAPDEQPDWSPDGSKIAFVSYRGGNADIYTMYPNGTFIHKVTMTPTCWEHDPAWSPDGTKIAFAQECASDPNYHIAVVRADNGAAVPFSDWSSYHLELSAHCQHVHPTWSTVAPKGTPTDAWIAYQRMCGMDSDIALLNGWASVTDFNPIYVDFPPGDQEYPDWSPDGSKIVYDSNEDGDWEIFFMNADGTWQTQFFDDPAMDIEPKWSHDGSKIAFVSNRDGPLEIYVMKADGTGLTRLNAVGMYPDWR